MPSEKPCAIRSSRSPRASSRRAFTLVELVIAIAVGALVVATIATVLSRISRSRDAAKLRLEAVSRASAALDQVRRDVASVIRDADLFNSRVLIYDATSFTPYGAVDRDEILVFNNRLRPMRRDAYAGEGGEYETQYRVEDDAGGSALWVRRDTVPDEVLDGGGIVTPAADGLVGLSIEAYDGEAWYPDWDSDLMGLPWALRITVTATGDMPGDEPSAPERALAVLRTQVAIDRIVPPPPPPEEEDPAAEPGAGGEESEFINPDTGEPIQIPPDGGVVGVPGGPGRPGGPGSGRPGGGWRPGGGGGGPGIDGGGGPVGGGGSGGGMGRDRYRPGTGFGGAGGPIGGGAGNDTGSRGSRG